MTNLKILARSQLRHPHCRALHWRSRTSTIRPPTKMNSATTPILDPEAPAAIGIHIGERPIASRQRVLL